MQAVQLGSTDNFGSKVLKNFNQKNNIYDMQIWMHMLHFEKK